MPDTLEGRTIDRYKIIRAIREGAVGAVYQAEDTSLARPVALKFLKLDQTEDPGLVKRLHQEAKTMARLEHPHIVSVYDFVESDEHVYVAMQFVDGESLQQRLDRKGRLPVEEVLRVIRDCARGLAAAHEQGILHRDMKPSNVILTRRGEVKVADFGLAHPAGDAPPTKSGRVEGTPHYMSPEQCRGQAQDARSDIYSMGVMFYQLLSGEVPFGGRTIKEVLTRHVKEPVPDLLERFPDLQVGRDVADLIGGMMAKDPGDRPDAPELVSRVTVMAQGGGARAAVTAPRRQRPQRGSSVVRRGAMVVFALLFAGGAIGGALWFKEYSQANRELDAWTRVAQLQINEPAVREVALEEFLRQWPESRYAEEARQALDDARSEKQSDVVIVVPGGDGAPASTATREEVESARDRANFANDDARRHEAPVVMPEKYESAQAYLREGRELEDRGRLDDALERYKEAALAFGDVNRALEKRRSEGDEVREKIKEYEVLRKEAQRLSIPQLAAADWRQAEVKFGEGRSLLDEGEAFLAQRSIDFAIRDLTEALKVHRAAGKVLFEMNRLRGSLAGLRDRAVEAGAEQAAPQALTEGDRLAAEGNAALAAGDNATALDRFQAAARRFQKARQTAEVASSLSKPDPTPGTGSSGDGTGGSSGGASGSGETPQAGSVVPPAIEALFSVKPQYKDGVLRLSYPLAEEFEKDITILKNPENVHFDSWDFPRLPARYTFGGERSGLLFLDAEFMDDVEVEMKAQFYDVKEGRSFFRVLVMAEDNNSFYASDFGANIAIFIDGRRRSVTKSRHKPQWANPVKWVQKHRDLKIAMSYRDGKIQVTHRFSECAQRGSDKFTRGKIGFWWRNVTFVVKDLEVTGRLDPDWLKGQAEGGDDK